MTPTWSQRNWAWALLFAAGLGLFAVALGRCFRSAPTRSGALAVSLLSLKRFSNGVVQVGLSLSNSSPRTLKEADCAF